MPTVSVVQCYVGAEIGTSTDRDDTLASPVTAGNTLVSCVQFYNQGGTNVAPDFAVAVHDNHGNTWTRITASEATQLTGASYGQRVSWWKLVNAPAGSTTHSFTPNMGTWTFVTIWECTPSDVDVAVSPNNNIRANGVNAGSNRQSAGSFTPSRDGARALCGATADNSAANPYTVDPGWTSRFNSGAGDGTTWNGDKAQTTAAALDFGITDGGTTWHWAISGLFLVPPGAPPAPDTGIPLEIELSEGVGTLLEVTESTPDTISIHESVPETISIQEST